MPASAEPGPAAGPGPEAPDASDAIYAIGDVHGCYALLVTLLERIVTDVEGTAAGDAILVFLGDYVDRGPATAEVIAALLWIERHGPFPTVFLRGNHEQVMLDYLDDPVRHRDWLGFGGAATLRSYGVEVADDPETILDHRTLRDRLLDRLPAAHLDFLRRTRWVHESDEFVFVHAGVRPGVPLQRHDREDFLWIREGFLEEQSWKGKRVVHGHTWTGDAPQVLAHRIGVDTGAYETGVLTAAKLQGPTVAFISTAD